MSTAVERVMRERGDCCCFHEPFMYDYYVHRQVTRMPHFDVDPSLPQCYQEIKKMLLSAAEKAPVFIKDMSYYVIPALFDDSEFANRITHSFLIRNPLNAILSYYKLDQNLTLEEIGLEAQWRHAHWLQHTLGITPMVLSAEKIQADVQGTMTQYWEYLGLEFRQCAFQWKLENTPDDWQQVAGWHNNVSSSQTIKKPSADLDCKRRQEFTALAKQHPKLQSFLDHHLIYYNKLNTLVIG